MEFSRSTAPREGYVPITELMEYESIYPKCNGTWFRDQLTGEDLLIYNSYLYALEHRYTWFKLYVEDSDKDFSYIITVHYAFSATRSILGLQFRTLRW